MGWNANSKGIDLPNNNRTRDSSPMPMIVETKFKRSSIIGVVPDGPEKESTMPAS